MTYSGTRSLAPPAQERWESTLNQTEELRGSGSGEGRAGAGVPHLQPGWGSLPLTLPDW